MKDTKYIVFYLIYQLVTLIKLICEFSSWNQHGLTFLEMTDTTSTSYISIY